MIISKSKEKQDVINMLDGVQSVFLIGCSECASLCGTGSPEALAEMKQSLEDIGKKVTGTFVAKTGCQVLGTKVELKGNKDEVESADAILVMSCGAGTQSLRGSNIPACILWRIRSMPRRKASLSATASGASFFAPGALSLKGFACPAFIRRVVSSSRSHS